MKIFSKFNLILCIFIFLLSIKTFATTYIDVMFVYDTNAYNYVKSYWGGSMDNHAASRVARWNTVMANSGLDITYRVTSTMSIDYTSSGCNSNELYSLCSLANSLSSTSEIKNNRVADGADLVIEYVYTGITQGVVGLAFTDLIAYYGLCMAEINWATGTYDTDTHEIGHNMSLKHSTTQLDDPGGDGLYSYGNGYHFGKYCTVMAYEYDGYGNSYSRCGLFSNPRITYSNQAAGNYTYADAYRALNQTKSVVAAYKDLPTSPPTVSSYSPYNKTLDEGATATFSISSSSGVRYYQWERKNSNSSSWTEISGATESSYSFTAYASDNNALFRCKLSNSAGTTYSREATLTVNVAGYYQMTISSGSGTGSYQEGSIVSIIADDPSEGYEFDQWTGDIDYLEDPYSATTNLTVPSSNISITATYKIKTYIFLFGTVEYAYTPGTRYSISAYSGEGVTFVMWTGDIEYLDDPYSSPTILTMPAKDIYIKGVYEYIPPTISVKEGTLSTNSFSVGDMITITANNPPEGYVFDQWTGDIDCLEDPYSSTTKLTVPSGDDISITATYKLQTYILLLGTTEYEFEEGRSVTLTNNQGVLFAKWGGDIEYLDNPYANPATLTMPAKDIAIYSTYRDEGTHPFGSPVEYSNTVTFKYCRISFLYEYGYVQENSTVAAYVGNELRGLTTISKYGAFTKDFSIGIKEDNEVVRFELWTPSDDKVYFSSTDSRVADTLTLDLSMASTTVYTSFYVYFFDYDLTSTFTLTVNNGSGSGSYNHLDVVKVIADDPLDGSFFCYWESDTGVFTYTKDLYISEYEFLMNATDISISAVYIEMPTDPFGNVVECQNILQCVGTSYFLSAYYKVQENSIIAAFVGNELRGKSVIVAGDSVYGMRINLKEENEVVEFKLWTPSDGKVYNGDISITMPLKISEDSSYQWHKSSVNFYDSQSPSLVIWNGQGTGQYQTGDIVTIVADEPSEGMEFDKWIGDIEYLEDIYSSTTNLTIPSVDISITATYRDIEDYNYWTRENGLSGDNADMSAIPYYDNITNLEKFLFGLSGNKSTVYGENPLFGYSISGNTISLSYPVNKDATEVEVKVYISEDLLNWTEISSTQTGESGNFDIYTNQETIPVSGKIFIKLEAIQQ